MNFGGEQIEATVTGANENALTVIMQGNQGALPWRQIGPAQFRDLAACVTEDRELLSAYARAAGLP